MDTARRGFTLLEMLMVLTIVGAVTAIGFNTSLFMPDPLDDSVRAVVRHVSAARSKAVLLRKPVVLQLHELGMRIDVRGEKEDLLPEAVRVVSVNGFPPDIRHGKLVFHPFGLVQESVIHLEHVSRAGGVRQRSVYVPGIGAPQVLDGHQDMDYIMKELL